MELLYISCFQFEQNENQMFAFPAYGDAYWQKYLDVFDTVQILGEPVAKKYRGTGLVQITNKRVSLEILPSNAYPSELRHDAYIKERLSYYISKADAVLIKPSSRKGIMAIKIAKRFGKPYMVELTGDLRTSYKDNPNIIKRYYGAYLLYWQVLKNIKDCQFGLYVSEQYLPKMYPIAGVQCGCTDAIIPAPEYDALKCRLEKILKYNEDTPLRIGLVGAYHGNRKGIDTAIQAISKIKDYPVTLHILGKGVKADRDVWMAYANKYGIENKVYFDTPLNSIKDVLKWNDNMDLIILPSRSEGLPRCIIESMSRACPCIVSNVCGLPELVPEEWLHDPGDYNKLSMLIKRMISNKEMMMSSAKENFTHSLDYSFESLRSKRNDFLLKFKKYAQEYNRPK